MTVTAGRLWASLTGRPSLNLLWHGGERLSWGLRVGARGRPRGFGALGSSLARPAYCTLRGVGVSHRF